MITRRRVVGRGASLAAFALGAGPMFAQGKASAMPDEAFWVPEEADPHLRTFMQWPVNGSVHPDPVFKDMLQQSIADLANTISQFEPVVMLMDDVFASEARQKLGSAVEIWDIPTDDLWCRDSGPLFVRNAAGRLAVRSVNFNGWGNKQTHKNDGKVAERVAERLGIPFLDNGIVGEAGGVETDGDGTLMAHESSWLNPNRNAGTREEVTALLLQAMGAEKVIWSPGVMAADITDYHIDALARFVGPGKIVIQLPDAVDESDPWSVSAFETYDVLTSATDAKGRSFEFTILPEPQDSRVRTDDFVASYVNYYVCNGAVIAAQFGDQEADREAASKLAGLYPGREIVTLNVDPIGETGGGIHCATQQQPAT